jgi:hypothetical protein
LAAHIIGATSNTIFTPSLYPILRHAVRFSLSKRANRVTSFPPIWPRGEKGHFEVSIAQLRTHIAAKKNVLAENILLIHYFYYFEYPLRKKKNSSHLHFK